MADLQSGTFGYLLTNLAIETRDLLREPEVPSGTMGHLTPLDVPSVALGYLGTLPGPGPSRGPDRGVMIGPMSQIHSDGLGECRDAGKDDGEEQMDGFALVRAHSTA